MRTGTLMTSEPEPTPAAPESAPAAQTSASPGRDPPVGGAHGAGSSGPRGTRSSPAAGAFRRRPPSGPAPARRDLYRRWCRAPDSPALLPQSPAVLAAAGAPGDRRRDRSRGGLRRRPAVHAEAPHGGPLDESGRAGARDAGRGRRGAPSRALSSAQSTPAGPEPGRTVVLGARPCRRRRAALVGDQEGSWP